MLHFLLNSTFHTQMIMNAWSAISFHLIYIGLHRIYVSQLLFDRRYRGPTRRMTKASTDLWSLKFVLTSSIRFFSTRHGEKSGNVENLKEIFVALVVCWTSEGVLDEFTISLTIKKHKKELAI